VTTTTTTTTTTTKPWRCRPAQCSTVTAAQLW